MSNKSNGGGIGVLGCLFLVFVTLKLADVIDWSWWYVTMPLWIAPALIVGGGAIVLVVVAVVEGLKNQFKGGCDE